MTSFLAVRYYSSPLVLLVGVVTFIGLLGWGIGVLRLLRWHLPTPWKEATASLLGLQLLSTLVQALGMAHAAGPAVLIILWAALVVTGGFAVYRWLPLRVPSLSPVAGVAWPLAVICGLSFLARLLISAAPSTKNDEIYYHMLTPCRIALDGALLFYQAPWVSAIWLQMTFQIAMAPLHAIRCPDASNVISVAFGTQLLWLIWRLARDSGKPGTWIWFWLALLSVGLYPVVWHVTAGSHALGDLAMTAAVVAFLQRDRIIAQTGPAAYGGMLSVLCWSAASTKISLLPLSVALLLWVGVLLIYRLSQTQRWRVALVMAGPWILFAGPLLVWTWVHSGSPLGPILAGVFGPSVYDAAEIQSIFAESRAGNRPSLAGIAKVNLLNYCPVLWIGMIAGLAWAAIPKLDRWIGSSLMVMQLLVIYILLPYDARFLGGLHYGILAWLILSPPARMLEWFEARPLRPLAACGILFPWLAVQLFYSMQFFPVVLGLQSKEAFCRRYVAFFDDFQKLDKILPPDSVLLMTGFRLGAVYSPRPMYLMVPDLPRDREIYIFASPEQALGTNDIAPGLRAGPVVYTNAHSIGEVFRTPGKAAIEADLHVVRVLRK